MKNLSYESEIKSNVYKNMHTMYNFKYADEVKTIMAHNALRGKDKSEWKLSEMVDGGLVTSYDVGEIVGTGGNGKFKFIYVVNLWFQIGKYDTLLKMNLFGTNAEASDAKEVEKVMMRGDGEFLLDDWVDVIDSNAAEAKSCEKGRQKCFRIGIAAANPETPTRIVGCTSGIYYNVCDENGNLLFGNMWHILGTKISSIKVPTSQEEYMFILSVKREDINPPYNYQFNILKSDGELLWKHWVTLKQIVAIRETYFIVILPEKDGHVLFDLRRFAYLNGKMERKIKNLYLYSDGRILSDSEILEKCDRSENLPILFNKDRIV